MGTLWSARVSLSASRSPAARSTRPMKTSAAVWRRPIPWKVARRSARTAKLGAAYGLATMAGPLAGAFVTQHLSWRWTFFAVLPLALGAWADVLGKAGVRAGAHPADVITNLCQRHSEDAQCT